jgi:hypothetical protein
MKTILIILFSSTVAFCQSTLITANGTAGMHIIKNSSIGLRHTRGLIDFGSYVDVWGAYFQTHTNHPLRIGSFGSGILFPTEGLVIYEGKIRLGSNAPAISFKEIFSTTNLTQGSTTAYAHNLDVAEIISIKAVVDSGLNGKIGDEYKVNPGFQFSIAFDATNIYILTKAANSYNILGKSISIAITYGNN